MSDFIVPNGSNFLPETSGVSNIGAPSLYFLTGYFNSLVANNIVGTVTGIFDLTVTPPLTFDGVSVVGIKSGSSSSDGFISSGDWNKFNNYSLTSGNYLPLSGGTLTGGLSGTNATFNSVISGNSLLLGTNATIGINNTSASSTPANIDLGLSSGTNAGGNFNNIKVRTYNGGGINVYGIGVSANTQEYQVPLGSNHTFYAGNLMPVAMINSNGVFATSFSGINFSGIIIYQSGNQVLSQVVSPLVKLNDTVSILSGSVNQNGYISSGDWVKFNNYSNTSGNYLPLTGGKLTGALSGLNATFNGTVSGLSGVFNNTLFQSGLQVFDQVISPLIKSAGDTITIQSGNTNTNGYIASGDWNTFNSGFTNSNIYLNTSGNYLPLSGGKLTGQLSGTTETFNSGFFGFISGNQYNISGIGNAATIYQSGILYVSGIAATGGPFLPLAGGTLSGPVGYTVLSGNLLSGISGVFSSILPFSSGNGTIGNTSNYYSDTYSNTFHTLINSIQVSGTNTRGSVNTSVVCWSGIVFNYGKNITYTSNGVNGDTFTVNANGIYTCNFAYTSNSNMNIFITKNSTATTAKGLNLLMQNGNAGNGTHTSNQAFCSWTGPLFNGDIVRTLADNNAAPSDTANSFIITQIIGN